MSPAKLPRCTAPAVGMQYDRFGARPLYRLTQTGVWRSTVPFRVFLRSAIEPMVGREHDRLRARPHAELVGSRNSAREEAAFRYGYDRIVARMHDERWCAMGFSRGGSPSIIRRPLAAIPMRRGARATRLFRRQSLRGGVLEAAGALGSGARARSRDFDVVPAVVAAKHLPSYDGRKAIPKTFDRSAPPFEKRLVSRGSVIRPNRHAVCQRRQRIRSWGCRKDDT